MHVPCASRASGTAGGADLNRGSISSFPQVSAPSRVGMRAALPVVFVSTSTSLASSGSDVLPGPMSRQVWGEGVRPKSWIAIGALVLFSTMTKPLLQRFRLMQPLAVSVATSSGVEANSSMITSSKSSVGSTSCPFPRRSSATA